MKLANLLALLISSILYATVKTEHSEKPQVQALMADWSPNGINSTEMTFYLAQIRSFIQGFQQGLYNNNSFKLSSACLQSSFVNPAIQVEDAFSAGNTFKILAVMSPMIQIAYNLQKSCNLNELIWMLLSVCEKGSCNSSTVVSNATKNLFSFTGSFNNIAESFTDSKKTSFTNLALISQQYNDIGVEFGKMLKLLTSFNRDKAVARKFY
ncbi:UNKNOWN [Stylonychia lemnae]|uniref:Uncharacterized protein n=1 Tax=Stylonychia lemnae TaxID=5949 RepID=A0A078B9A0_STYLE|nr:UNKNOWN [Stylonychia lemnae]|eukprot:CDW90959.1 UNKNOWN [Stylonychia lemnae]